MIEVLNNSNKHILEVKVIEKLSSSDLDHFKPVVEKHVAEEDHPKLLIIMEEFGGWDSAQAFFKELDMDANFIGKFTKIAVAGDANWEKWLTQITGTVLREKIKFFDHKDLTQARSWLQ